MTRSIVMVSTTNTLIVLLYIACILYFLQVLKFFQSTWAMIPILEVISSICHVKFSVLFFQLVFYVLLSHFLIW